MQAPATSPRPLFLASISHASFLVVEKDLRIEEGVYVKVLRGVSQVCKAQIKGQKDDERNE